MQTDTGWTGHQDARHRFVQDEMSEFGLGAYNERWVVDSWIAPIGIKEYDSDGRWRHCYHHLAMEVPTSHWTAAEDQPTLDSLQRRERPTVVHED